MISKCQTLLGFSMHHLRNFSAKNPFFSNSSSPFVSKVIFKIFKIFKNPQNLTTKSRTKETNRFLSLKITIFFRETKMLTQSAVNERETNEFEEKSRFDAKVFI